MKCQSLFSWKNKKNVDLLSAEFAHRVVKSEFPFHNAALLSFPP